MYFPFLCTLCTIFQMVSSSQTKIFGDSILASNTPIVGDFEKWSNVSIEDYATIGSSLQEGWKISIPAQYEQNRDPVPQTILMDGGGNDVNSIRSECQVLSESCVAMIDRILVILHDLLKTMREDGVEYILYSGFYYIPGLERVVDYGSDEIKKVCLVEQRCYFTDLRNLTVQVGWDGMHPVESSYHDIAKELWKTKVHYNIPIE